MKKNVFKDKKEKQNFSIKIENGIEIKVYNNDFLLNKKNINRNPYNHKQMLFNGSSRSFDG